MSFEFNPLDDEARDPHDECRYEIQRLNAQLTEAVGLIEDLLLPDSAVDWDTRKRAGEFLKQVE